MDNLVDLTIAETNPITPDVFAESKVEEVLHELDPSFVQSELVKGLISLGIIGFVAICSTLIYWLFRGFDWVLFSAIGVAVFLMLLIGFSSLVWPRVFYRTARWRLDLESLEIRQGVFWNHRISIPRGRVQHADVSQGPLQRHFGLGKLKVYTAGTYQASVELDGLNHSVALELRDQLIKQTQHSG